MDQLDLFNEALSQDFGSSGAAGQQQPNGASETNNNDKDKPNNGAPHSVANGNGPQQAAVEESLEDLDDDEIDKLIIKPGQQPVTSAPVPSVQSPNPIIVRHQSVSSSSNGIATTAPAPAAAVPPQHRYQIVRGTSVASGLRAPSGAVILQVAPGGGGAGAGSRGQAVIRHHVIVSSSSSAALRFASPGAPAPSYGGVRPIVRLAPPQLPRQAPPPPADKPTDLLELALAESGLGSLTGPSQQQPPQPPPVQVPFQVRLSTPQSLPRSNHRQSGPVGAPFSPLVSVGQPGSGSTTPQSTLKSAASAPALTQQERERLARDRLAHRNLALRRLREEAADELEDQLEELGAAETYNDYRPQKLRIGSAHPDVVVESSSLAAVEPPDVHYELRLPSEVIDDALLSSAQLEAVVYACQRHETILPSGQRAGYLLGDGPGMGKGRVLAALLYENYLRGRKRALWLSVSNDLRVDAERDLRDLLADRIVVHALHRMKYAKINSDENGRIRKGCIFATYASLIGESGSASSKYKTRLKQLVNYLGREFEGLIILDECHRAKNLYPAGSQKPSKTGQTVLDLQNQLPMARVVYASATGASEPKNMGYMTRLGLWGSGSAFPTFTEFINTIERRGIGVMELLAMDMKLRGMYIARQLSFHGVQFGIDEVPLCQEYTEMYNASCALWQQAKSAFEEASKRTDPEGRNRKMVWGQFWSAHQRFFKHLCVSAKIDRCVELATEAVEAGHCVVIGLQSTGEARTTEMLEEAQGDLSDFVSTAKGVFQSLVEKHFPSVDLSLMDLFEGDDTIGEILGSRWVRQHRLPAGDGAGSGSESGAAPPREVTGEDRRRAAQLKADLLRAVEALDEQLPKNALDELIDRLGGPAVVAEMTGRRGRVVADDAGQVTYESRRETELSMELINLTEKQRFMDGDKLIAVISEAASSGISLQADKRALNQRRRVHITLELPWSADRAIQQFGRTHRSNQVSAPRYVFLISELAGERRFAASVAKRLESLGALTHGDRRAGESRDLSRFNLDNRFGRLALETAVKSAIGMEEPIAEVPVDLWFDFPQALVSMGMVGKQPNGYYLDREYNYIPKFLNRLLGLEVALQNALFQYFADTLAEVTLKAKREGKLDIGIADLGVKGESLQIEDTESYETRYFGDCCQVHLHTVRAERGLSWHRASEIFYLHERPHDGFYLPKQAAASGLKQPLLAVAPSRKQRNKRRRLEGGGSSSTAADEAAALMRLYRPSTGQQARLEDLIRLQERWQRTTDLELVKRLWEQVYERSRSQCAHAISSASGLCGRQAATGKPCEVGLRVRVYHLLAGSVLSVWPTLERVCRNMQLVRMRASDGKRIVGVLVPPESVGPVHSCLSQMQ
ncbi:hypothetical protein BOX15_Mlig015939g2 [Macrostomum lignano]|uniref:Strawberry notch AAA domain-containing protein n=1 Tax=Macrostomum lignano TaxID=282301 RepID=A0A267FJZ2_9PLAT|nr:hypothetical protein BOX15_Mlig015939g2 [Macrostomum lignano]